MNESNNTTQTLLDYTQPAGKVIKIECKKCGHIDAPHKWKTRWFLGILFLAFTLNPLLLLFFVATNPYICANCDERNQLVKILNDNRKVPQKSMPKKTFLVVSILLLVLIAFGGIIALSESL